MKGIKFYAALLGLSLFAISLKAQTSEYKVLYAYLQFPQRYWRLANRYYYNEVNWGQNTFGSKIESIINEQENTIKFLEDFKKEYNL